MATSTATAPSQNDRRHSRERLERSFELPPLPRRLLQSPRQPLRLLRHALPQNPFEFGQPVNIETIVSASAYVWDGSGQATADFGHTFRWTGVESIVDANGQAITDYTLTAASGADYVNPVPEPASMAALAIGAGGILRRRRKA